MGTTIVAAIITPATCIYLYAGDSRLYHFREVPTSLSNCRSFDHSTIARNGQDSARRYSPSSHAGDRQFLFRGQKWSGDFSVDPKWQEENPPIIHLKSNDLILLCSDGAE
jgi:serine/threonine protein phosphatase PrpC